MEASHQHQESSSSAVYLTSYACTSCGHVHGMEARGQPLGVTSLFPPFQKTDAGYDACSVEACTESMNLPPYFLRQGLSLGPEFAISAGQAARQTTDLPVPPPPVVGHSPLVCGH